MTVDANGKVTGKHAGSTSVTAKYVVYDTPVISSSVSVTVEPSVTDIDVENRSPQLALNNSQKLKIDLLDDKHTIIQTKLSRNLAVTSSDPNAVSVSLDPIDPKKPELRTITLTAIALPINSSPVQITVTAINKASAAPIPSTTLTVSILEIANFRNLSVSLNILPESTVKDMFGYETSRQFYVVSVSMMNDLKKENGDDLDSAILAFCSTIKAHVTMQKRKGNRGEWSDVTVADMDKHFVDPGFSGVTVYVTKDKDGKLIAVTPNAIVIHKGESRLLNVVTRKIDSKGVTIETKSNLNWKLCSPEGNVGQVSPEGVVRTEAEGAFRIEGSYPDPQSAGLKICLTVEVAKSLDTIPYQFEFRPMMSEFILNSFDARDFREGRPKAFRLLNGVATGLSFVNSAFRLKGASYVSNFTDKFTNLLVPGLDKLFPSLSDSHRQNLTRNLMQPIEQIAFGAPVTKFLLFPKADFTGLLTGYKTRISAINPAYFDVEVAVVVRRVSGNVATSSLSVVPSPGKP